MKKCLILLAILFFNCVNAQHTHLIVGDSIPAFSLYNQDGHLFDSRDYVGKKILVIYFYPKDESAVCTKEACSFRDNYESFSKEGAIVVGINSGSVESHKEFQQHHQLPFILLSDPDNKVLKMFGVKSKFFMTGRETFVVGMNGKIEYTYNSFTNGTAHAAETLKYIKTTNE